LAAVSPPLFPLLHSHLGATPLCGNPPPTRLQTSKWTMTKARTSSISFTSVPALNAIRICPIGTIAVTLSVELHQAPAGFRIKLNGSQTLKPGRVRFVPAGIHGSASFTFVSSPSPSNRASFLAVQWRSPTGRLVKLERATLIARYRGYSSC
jgi:hypothetical protein